MFHWMSCCILVLGTAAVSQGSKDSVRPRPGEVSDKPVFGLQVQMGVDGAVRKAQAAEQAAYRTEVPESRHATLVGHIEDGNPSHDPTALTPTNWHDESLDSVSASVESDCYEWQVMPEGLLYKAYLAGEKESRMAAVWLSGSGRDGIAWETALGGHVGLLRYGTTDLIYPEGWQLDLEGAALPRVDLGHESDLEACDFRAGFLSTWRYGPNAFKAGYYHLSSHLGDEYLLRFPGYTRLNYVRDAGIVGWTYWLNMDSQVYAEVAYAFNHEDGALPLEFQYGIQYSPMKYGLIGAPFAAINGHTREDFGYQTSVNVQAGWQWRGITNRTYRLGMQYYTGPALQYSFAGLKETLCGAGMWMDY